jgi:hypothetical protein
MRTILIFILLAVFSVRSAHAAEDCGRALREHVSGYLTIVKGMADYKAAMDAGYAACMVNYPQEFAPLRPVNDFLQTNMQREMDEAQAVLDHMLDNSGAQKTAEGSGERGQGQLPDRAGDGAEIRGILRAVRAA